jgi:ABC-2 type transport system ATP-binding protein
VIEIEHLSKSYGTVQAVIDLNLVVPRGELFCFLGPNGAGKTTTIKMLTGLVHPDAGSVRLCGFDLARDPLPARQLLGYIPDLPFLYERLTPPEFLEFVGDLYGVDRRRVNQACDEELTRFGLADHRRALVGDLSHGMRQRLIYVATFLHDPKILCIDEPLVGLDPYTIRMIKDLLKAKARSGVTVFLTTHILAVAEEIADRVGILSRGRLVALGPIDDLKKRHDISGDLESVFLTLTADDYGLPVGAGKEDAPPCIL